mgnify:FL=1
MDIRLEKIELMKLLLQTESESVLKKVREAFKNEEQGYISQEQYDIVAERRAEYLSGEGKYFSFKKEKKRIQEKTK